MKKSLVLATLLVATGLMATEAKDNWFAGIEIGNTSLETSVSVLGSTFTENESAGTQSIKVGKYLGNMGRVALSYSRYNSEATLSVNSYALGYDYMFYNSSKFTPFVGVSVGQLNFDATGLQADAIASGLTASKDKLDVSGVFYGAEIGATYEIIENLDFEIGARFASHSGDDTVTYSLGATSAAANFDLGTSTQWYVGANYNF